MIRFRKIRAKCCWSLILCPLLQFGHLDAKAADTNPKLQEIVSLLRLLWGNHFDADYQKYMLGSPPVVTLIPRVEMLKIAAARLDGRPRDGATTQGLTIGENPDVKIVVVYDDIAAIFVAASINHELAHLHLREKRLAGNAEEARVRKTEDTAFFEKVFGRDWFAATVSGLQERVLRVKKNGRAYLGYTPEAVEFFYQQSKSAGLDIPRDALHDRIVAHYVFIFTNSEADLEAALAYDN